MDWLSTQGFRINRATVYAHAAHGVQRTVVAPKPVAEPTDLLDMVIEAGRQAVAADPSIVSLRNALDAQRMKDQRREHQDDLRLELARLVMAGKVVVPLLAEPSEEGEYIQIE